MNGCTFYHKIYAVYQSHPNVDTDEKTGEVSLKTIRLWMSQADRDSGRSTRKSLKIGKAFKHIWPFLTPVEVEKLVDSFKKKFAPRDYHLITGKTREHFRNAYVKNTECQQNMPTSCHIKRLSDSCMSNKTFKFEGSDVIHPSEVYASGDFTQYSLTVGKDSGIIAARCIVYIRGSKASAAPIYASTAAAADKIRRHIIDDFPDCVFNDPSFYGASILFLQCDRGVIAPYFDFEPKYFDKEGVLASRGNYNGCDHIHAISGGSNDDDEHECDCCGDFFDMEDSGGYFDGSSYCDCCFDDETAVCEFSDERVRRCDTVEVTVSSSGYCQTECWCVDAAADNAVEVNDCLYSTESGLVFISNLSNDWHLIEDMAENDDGDYATHDEFMDDDSSYQINSDGIYYIPETDDSDVESTNEIEA